MHRWAAPRLRRWVRRRWLMCKSKIAAPADLANVMLQEFKLERLRELRRLASGLHEIDPDCLRTRDRVLRDELAALSALEVALEEVRGRPA